MPARPDPRPLPPLHESGTTPLTPVRRHGRGARANGDTPRPGSTVPRGVVYTVCLTALILVSLVLLGVADLPKVANVLALVVGAGSAGILLGRNLAVEIDGCRLNVQRVEGIPAQQLPHKDDQ